MAHALIDPAVKTYDILSAWRAWSDGPLQATDLLHGYELFWWARISKIVQLFAIAGLLLEVVGKERVQQWGSSLALAHKPLRHVQKRIAWDLKQTFRDSKDQWQPPTPQELRAMGLEGHAIEEDDQVLLVGAFGSTFAVLAFLLLVGAVVFVLALVVSEGAFRGYGDTKIPLVASLVASLINLVLDPIHMFPPIHWGVTGAATATALSQVGAVATYLYFLLKRQMLPRNKTTTTTTTTPVGTLEPTEDSASQETTTKSTRQIVSTIVGANLAMMTKQGSLLLGWAYATARATRLGADHVAAHQVGLSFWLVFALWLDGAAVAAQVLVSQSLKRTRRVRSLTKYMFKVATVQGLLSTMLIFGMGGIVPTLFTTDETIRAHLRRLVPNLAWQQILISWTLVVESLAVGGQQFGLLAGGTILSTVGAVLQIRQCHTVQQIWARGIVSLFAGRLLTALIGTARVNRLSLRLPWRQ